MLSVKPVYQSFSLALHYYSLLCVGTVRATSTCGMAQSHLAPGSIHMTARSRIAERQAALVFSLWRRPIWVNLYTPRSLKGKQVPDVTAIEHTPRHDLTNPEIHTQHLQRRLPPDLRGTALAAHRGVGHQRATWRMVEC